MATVYNYLQTADEFFAELQDRADLAESRRHRRFHAVLLLQRMTRGYLIRKHVAWLSKNATTIQCAFRMHRARKAYRAALRRAVRNKHARYYARAATMIQALWRGYYSRKTKFCYYTYRRWLRTVTERGERRAAEAAEFGIRSRADDLKILEEEARQWLAYVVFKLHHLLRTYNVAGVYSDRATHELSEFEKLLKAIKYTDYMKRLRRKYDEFVRKHKPNFSNKKLFPIIGEGADYWYLSLPEMYDLTVPVSPGYAPEKNRHSDTYHGKQHKEPFLWRKVRHPVAIEGRGPYTPPRSPKPLSPPAPAPTPTPGGGDATEPRKDPRFYLYVKYYRPRPDLMDYVDFHVNALLKRKCSIEDINLDTPKSQKTIHN
ncbi:spermatogenesis-associated protein 17 [Pectinophora gossypiella]|uniref:spermatogenesis-associated protein 17 n=1 Tax=Pectinophora gossypiella TaxID=13191 RepID=UPI00214E7E3A|nr:spermatogenesis-associated protein 17 [Pectinophora gossypiella]